MKKTLPLLLLLLFPALMHTQSIKQRLLNDLATRPRPHSVEDFSPVPHLTPMNQDTTLICWSFATSSFLESEMHRLGRPSVRLSVIFPMYCTFLEKAKEFVRTRGTSRFAPGDLFSGVVEVERQYGAMPASAYEGIKNDSSVYSHRTLYGELDACMRDVRERGMWNEEEVLRRVRVILVKYLGAPPETFLFEGRTYTAETFRDSVVRLPWNDYVLVTSFEYAPFNAYTELRVPDNWKHRSNFFNVPLDVFYSALRNAVAGGYSVAFDADISEPSYELTKDVGVIPDFDIPSAAIDQDAREFRFLNGTTTDDHLMHAVGVRRFGDADWFLVKDSWRTSFEGPHRGYFFFDASYMKLKALAFLVHLDGVPDIRGRIASFGKGK